MRIYAGMDQRMPLAEVAEHARRVEDIGYDGLNVPDAVHDGLLAAQAAIQATTRLRVATSVLVCFPRSPMNTAHAAWDLQDLSGGRFELGLGTQVRGNIVGRYGTPWTAPVPRMREYVQALRAIWDCWQHGGPLEFLGEHYRFTRMQPFFNPGPIEHPEIPVLLGAVGPKMTALVGEVADGIVTHPTNSSPRFLREATLPEIALGARRADRADRRVALVAAGFVATGETPAQVSREREKIRELLTFLYATPAYHRSLALHGWEEVGQRLHALSREGRWGEMAGAIDDEMLDALVPSGTYDEIDTTLLSWYGGLADGVTLPLPDSPRDDPKVAAVIRRLRRRSRNGAGLSGRSG